MSRLLTNKWMKVGWHSYSDEYYRSTSSGMVVYELRSL
jgi:hypothetical protein